MTLDALTNLQTGYEFSAVVKTIHDYTDEGEPIPIQMTQFYRDGQVAAEAPFPPGICL